MYILQATLLNRIEAEAKEAVYHIQTKKNMEIRFAILIKKTSYKASESWKPDVLFNELWMLRTTNDFLAAKSPVLRKLLQQKQHTIKSKVAQVGRSISRTLVFDIPEFKAAF